MMIVSPEHKSGKIDLLVAGAILALFVFVLAPSMINGLQHPDSAILCNGCNPPIGQLIAIITIAGLAMAILVITPIYFAGKQDTTVKT